MENNNGQPEVVADNGGLRDDKGKTEFHLIPLDGLAELGRVYTFGAKKYAPRNWERGMLWSRCYNSLLRHLYAFWSGERCDGETGVHHMAHVAWNAIALLVYSLRSAGIDDRKPGNDISIIREAFKSVEKDNIAKCNALMHPNGREESLKRLDDLVNRDMPPIGKAIEIKPGIRVKMKDDDTVWDVVDKDNFSGKIKVKSEFLNKEQWVHIRSISGILPPISVDMIA